jgi:hypothetical protein
MYLSHSRLCSLPTRHLWYSFVSDWFFKNWNFCPKYSSESLMWIGGLYEFSKNFLWSPFAKPRVLCGPHFQFWPKFLKHVFIRFSTIIRKPLLSSKQWFSSHKNMVWKFWIFFIQSNGPFIGPRVIFQKFKLWLKMFSKLSNSLVKTMI